MQKGEKLIFLLIILYAAVNLGVYYFSGGSREVVSSSPKTAEVLTLGFKEAYSVKSSNVATQQDKMTEEEVLKYMSISREELFNLVEDKSSGFPYSKTNDNYTFSRKALDKWLERCHANIKE